MKFLVEKELHQENPYETLTTLAEQNKELREKNALLEQQCDEQF